MRQIAMLPDAPARQLAGYLKSLQIETRLEPGPEGVAVWVCDEDKVGLAREELAAFTRDPANARFRAAPFSPLPSPAPEREVERPRQAAEEDDEETETGGERPVTIALIAVSVVVALTTQFGKESPAAVEALRMGLSSAGPPLAEVRAGEVWRLITPIFLHFGLLHLIFNMLMLLALGGRVEGAQGPGRLLALVLLFGVLSNLGEYFFDWSFGRGLRYEIGVNFGGMSGVLYGLFGYLWMCGRSDPEGPLHLPPDTVVILLGWFVLCLFGAFDTETTRIANVAHAVGLVAGVGVGLVIARHRRPGRGA